MTGNSLSIRPKTPQTGGENMDASSSSTAAALLLDLPEKALGGIDLLSFTVTPRFLGIKDLPVGFHFLFTASTSSLSVRHGAWIHVQATGLRNTGPADLFIKKWDAATESLVPETDAARVLHWRANLGSIWREGLTPYRQSATDPKSNKPEYERNDWRQLTDCISQALLGRVLGGADPDHWTLTSASSAAVDVDDIPGIEAANGRSLDERELFFLPVDLKQTWREGATGRERTEAAQDRSWYLAELARNHCAQGDWDEVLGELEFCFLMVLTLNNYSCLEQWRRLLSLLLTCKAVVAEKPDFFVMFIATLKLQLQHCDDVEGGGLFDLSDEGATFLRALIVRFKRTLDELPGNGKQDVMDEFDDLQDYLRDAHGWRFDQGLYMRSGTVTLEDGEEIDMDDMTFDEDDEEGDYAPQVVDAADLSAEQRQMLGMDEGGLSQTEKSLKDALRDQKTTRRAGGAMLNEAAEVSDDSDMEEEADLEEMDARY